MKVFSLIFAVISLITFSDAHPGGLDANGGHYDRKTGEYHYHRKPAAKPIAKESTDMNSFSQNNTIEPKKECKDG